MVTEMTKSLEGEDRERVARRAALQRLVTPGDVAASVLYLMSDAGRNVTGTVLTVDAGATA
jgi:3-oxoacyl-[acyl-carrier protein] reductase